MLATSKNIRLFQQSILRSVQVKANPANGRLNRFKSTCPASTNVSDTPSTTNTTLAEIPSLPYLGSLIPQWSKTPPFDPNNVYEYWPSIRQQFGDFYSMGLPGLGKGREGIFYVVNDPDEMMKVIRQEKTSTLPYPRGIIEGEWPLIRYFSDQGSFIGKGNSEASSHDEKGFFGRGETWKRLRTFLQTDLLSPQSSKRYIAGIVQAGQIASQAAPSFADDLSHYLNRCAFDMFNSLMYGELTKTADLKYAKKENVDFCKDNVEAFTTMVDQMMLPNETIIGHILGIKTSAYKDMSKAWDRTCVASDLKFNSFLERFENDYDSLTDLEKNSYIAHAIVRQKESDDFTVEELQAVAKIMLSASVDTTSAPMAWNLYHIAVNQDIQEKLYNELSSALEKEGCINEEFLKQKTCPYLHAVIRESHRITPALPFAIIKENSLSDIEIHGSVIQKDSVIAFDSLSLGRDPELVENPREFRPERWFDDAVKARKGTPAEVLDHPFYKAPFSQGSRRCPGSRVASNEILILLSQIVLDWKVKAPSNIKSLDDMEYQMRGMIVPTLPKLEFQSRE